MRAGAEVVHSTPRKIIGDEFLDGKDFDAVVFVVRSGYPNARSMVENYHASDHKDRNQDLDLAYSMIPQAIYWILHNLNSFDNFYLITYEALVHEPSSIYYLCEDLGLFTRFNPPKIGNGNDKYYNGEYFRDTTPLENR
jgi:hypothetical protein